MYIGAQVRQTERSPHKRRTLTVEVKFGTPSDDCRGLGICKVVPKASWRMTGANTRGCHRAMAYLSVTGRQLEFHFIRRTMCAYTWGKYFRGGEFVVTESISLPGSVLSALRLSRKEKGIGAGRYPIRESEELVTVVINCQQDIR